MTDLEGKMAPLFTLRDQNGEKLALKSLRGRQVVVYFYPKDDTPGCTKEACGFRDLWKQYQQAGVTVIGISPDMPETHRDFIKKYRLPFILLADPDKKTMEKYGAWGEKMMYGKKVTGVIRSTVWINEKGRVVRHWRRVARAADHPQKVLEAIQSP